MHALPMQPALRVEYRVQAKQAGAGQLGLTAVACDGVEAVAVSDHVDASLSARSSNAR